MQIPKRRSEILAQSKHHDDHFLTTKAIERIKKTIERLEKVERPKVIEEMQEAATQGDFSENAGYQAAKAQLRRINGRIDHLKEQLKFAIVIPVGSQDGKIRIGSTVTVRMNNHEMTYEILGSHESDPANGRISHLSPIGAAMLQKQVGDTFTVNDRVFEIISVK